MDQKPDQHLRARNLYFQTDLSQQRISELLDVNRKTLYLWIKEGGWKAAKYAANNAPSVLAGQYYAQLGALNKHILQREDRPYPTREESDIIRKLTVTIKHLGGRQTIPDTIELFENFTNRLALVDQDLNKKLIVHMDRYIKDLSQKNMDFATNDDAADREFEQWLAQQAAQEQAPKNTVTPSPGNGATGASVPNTSKPIEPSTALTYKQNGNTSEAPKKDENGASKESENTPEKPKPNIIPLPPTENKLPSSGKTIVLGKKQEKGNYQTGRNKRKNRKKR